MCIMYKGFVQAECIILPGTWRKLMLPDTTHRQTSWCCFPKHPSLQRSPLNLMKMLSRYDTFFIFFKQSNLTDLSNDGFIPFFWKHLACRYFFSPTAFWILVKLSLVLPQVSNEMQFTPFKRLFKIIFLYWVWVPLDSACLDSYMQ